MKEILRVVLANTDTERVFPEMVETGNAKPSLTGSLLKGMERDAYHSDEDAALDLYGTEPSNPRFRTLKSRMYDRLVHSVLFLGIKQPDHSEYSVNYFKVYRSLFAARILMKYAAHQAGFVVAVRALSISERYQFTDISFQLAVVLRDYSALISDNSSFNTYHSKVKRYVATLSLEQESDYLLDGALLELKTSHFEHSHYIEEHKRVYDRIATMNRESESHLLTINEHRAAIMFYETLEDYQKVCDHCENAITYLESNKRLSQTARVGEFRLRRLSAILCLRRRIDSEDGLLCLSLFSEGGYNWLNTIGTMLVSSLYHLDYISALYFYKMATAHARFESLDDISKERWTIYNAYLFLCEQLSLTDTARTPGRDYRLSTFLNSTFHEAKAKGDANSLIEVFHVLHLMLTENHDDAEKRIEYLNVYCTRYLRDRHFDRLRYFIKALQHIPKCRGDILSLRVKVEPFVAAIRSAASTPIPAEINEILPYDVMLVALLSKLEVSESW